MATMRWAGVWIAAFSMVTSAGPLAAQDMPADYQAVLTTLARKGSFKDGVLKGNVPRSDLRVTIAGRPAPTPFGFGGSAQQLATGVRAAVDQLGKAPQR